MSTKHHYRLPVLGLCRGVSAAIIAAVLSVALPAQAQQPVPGGFDIARVPVSTQLAGTFPYLQAPKGYSYTHNYDRGEKNGGIPRGALSDFGREHFAAGGTLVRKEGKTFKAMLEKNRGDGQSFNQLLVDASYERAILALGGVKTQGGKVPRQVLDQLDGEQKLQSGYSLGHDDVQTYVIRRPNSEVWVQFSTYAEGGSIAIVETAALQALEVKAVTASQIGAELGKSGQVALDILFDTDKATLAPEGGAIVTEIARLLRQQPALKLSVEGHTDDTGTAARNQELSRQRAETVVQVLGAFGIEAARLRAIGHGATQPRAPNDTPAHRAQNRRVVLVRR